MVDIVVMYADPVPGSKPDPRIIADWGLSVVRKPLSEAASLRRDGVIAISISHPKQPDTNLRRKRYQLSYEHDYYVFCWTDVDSYLGGYNDDKYWFKHDEPWKTYGEGFVHRFPFIMPENSITLEGVMISPKDYARAKDIFTDVNGEMG